VREYPEGISTIARLGQQLQLDRGLAFVDDLVAQLQQRCDRVERPPQAGGRPADPV